MVVRRKLVLPELFPQPKNLVTLEGMSELSNDIRLVTSNVLPLQRKAIRSILTDAGVKVVANKKRYIVDAKVEDASEFDLSKVPEASQKEYYELKVVGSEVFIRAPYQEGTVWASQTLASIFKRNQSGAELPNILIKDWPDIPSRGIFVENKWGPDRMTMGDWYQAIDTLSSVKMNIMGIGLYGCWGSCRFEGPDKPTEFLNVPIVDREDLYTPHHLEWYSPEDNEWKVDNYASYISQNNMLADIVNYGQERGVTVVPYVNSFGHNTYFPRVMPELSALNADGTPTGVGYCITSPEVRAFIESFYSSIIERYYPKGIEYFHMQMDEVWPDHPWPNEPKKSGDPWCQCSTCAKQAKEKNIQDYVIWLVGMLVEKGVQKVVMWNDQMTRHMDAFDAKFVKRLEKAGLKDKLIIDWWWYNNKELNDTTRVRVGKKHGVEGWVSPMTCYYNWHTYDYRIPNIELMLNMCHEEGGIGAVSYAVHDPSHLDHEALLAGFAWEGVKEKRDAILKRWAIARFNDGAAKFKSAQELLLKAATTPFYSTCLNYTYTYVGGGDFPRQYPGEALDKLLAQPEDANVVEKLKLAAATAKEADDLYIELLEQEGLDDFATRSLKSLRGEATRIKALATAFAWLVETKKALAENSTVKKSFATECQKVQDDFIEALRIIEVNKPSWVVPASLQALSSLLAFLQQFQGQLVEFGGKKKANQLHWGLLPKQDEQEQ
jgi:hypothetical protein